jgi:hypothetical protein
MLPNISIIADVVPKQFLNRLEQLAKHFSSNVEIERNSDLPGFDGWDALILTPKNSPIHKDLCSVVFYNTEAGNRIVIEMTAKQWEPDPPTFEAYVNAARSLFDPLIKAYNKRYYAKRRLLIQTNIVKKRVLPPKTTKRFTSFILCANKEALHPFDWKRFYQFINHCHIYRVKLSESSLKRLLIERGFNTEKAEYLSDIYCHGRKLLSL